MNAFWWYLAGFTTATVLAIWWYRGNLKPKLDALRNRAEDAAKAKVEKLRGKL